MTATSRPKGRFLVIVGPDGAGKSTLADALATAAPDGRATRYHHRIGLLPRRRASLVPPTRLYAEAPYPAWLSAVKIGYLFLDFLAGTLLRVRPAVRRGGWVILERGWWDIVVDPLRYRLGWGAGMARRLGGLLPGPDLLVVLEAPVETILARKTELDDPGVRRQLAGWREVAAAVPRSLVLDARHPVDELVASVLEALDSRRPEARTAPEAGHG